MLFFLFIITLAVFRACFGTTQCLYLSFPDGDKDTEQLEDFKSKKVEVSDYYQVSLV